MIDEENDHAAARSGVFGWNAYYRLGDIYNWMDSLEEKYPEVKVIVGGTSYENREIKGVKVTYGEKNKDIFIESGIHAREWIAPATVTYILNEILTRSDPTFRALVESFNWYIFPSFNPDGYEYTHTTYRLWRKTRSPSGDGCFGADPNRNWKYMFNEGGSSGNPCSDTYRGSDWFSEIETKSMSEYITSISENIAVYLGFHSSGQMLLIPYGFTNANSAENLMEIGRAATNKLKERYGTQYTVGNIVDIIYVASGSSMDWVRGTFDTPYTYTYELRDTGRYGFLLPATQIIPTGEETLDSVVVIIDNVLKALDDKGSQDEDTP
ncbi:Zinc carboxypeptidase A 1 [Gryllus bimaculatus]|nr:Zinc carboxypeptidase A 1 [Gryllus bimaculatus]